MTVRRSQQAITQSRIPQGSERTEPHPDGRLCRIVNLANGALLDITQGNVINYMIGCPASKAGIKMWRIIPMGPGYALRTADDIAVPRYLAPTSDGATPGKLVTLSTFPVFWDLTKTDEYGTSGKMTPVDIVGEWTCSIRWPFYDNEARVLDMEEFGKGTKVHVQPFRQPRHERCQFWRIQFFDEAPIYPPIYPPPSYGPLSNPSIGDHVSALSGPGLEHGAKYVIHNVKGNTVIHRSRFHPEMNTLFGSPCHGFDAQKWEAIDRGKGWAFKNIQNRQYMSIHQDPKNGANVITSQYDKILWEVERQESGELPGEVVYSFFLQNTNYAVTLSNFGSSEDSTDVVLWKNWNGPNQLWRFEKVG